MPNWIEGTLKLRGDYEKIRQFFMEGLDQSAGIFENAPIRCFVTDFSGKGYTNLAFDNSPHIRDTSRAFITGKEVYFEPGMIACIEIKQAWDFAVTEWIEISKKYGVDIRLFGFEMGYEFCREIEVAKGKLTIYKKITYSDYQWECPMPTLGG